MLYIYNMINTKTNKMKTQKQMIEQFSKEIIANCKTHEQRLKVIDKIEKKIIFEYLVDIAKQVQQNPIN